MAAHDIIPRQLTASMLETLAHTEIFKEAVAKRDAATMMRRTGLVAQLRQLEREAETRFPSQTTAITKAAAALKRAEAALREAQNTYNTAVNARASSSAVYDRERQAIEAQLSDSPMRGLIDAFRSEMLDDLDRTRRLFAFHNTEQRNAVTGAIIRITINNGADIAKRIAAANAAREDAEAMRYDADQSTVPARLAALRDALPPVGDLSDEATSRRSN